MASRTIHPCDNCGSTNEVIFIPDPECRGVHAWYACVDCRGRTGSAEVGDSTGSESDV